MQAHVHEVGGKVFDIRPFPGAVSHYQRHPVLAQQLDEGFAQKAFVADFHGVAQPSITLDISAAVALQALRTALCAFARSLAAVR
ncbi:hypothetical protein D3C76_1344390 [compost metagenome]